MPKKKITVFAGNECQKEKEKYYFSLAYQTGKLLANAGFTVVTGGGPGLMNEVSRGAWENGGETIGICLALANRKHSSYLSFQEMYHQLNKRQERLLALGDGYLALPGGIGTMYEIMAVLALKRKKEIPWEKPFMIIDSKYYQEFRDLLSKMEKEGFVDKDLVLLFSFAETPEEAVISLQKNIL